MAGATGELDGCPDAAELDAFLAGAGDDAERARMEAHLARCDECRQVLSALAPPEQGCDPTLPSGPAESELLPGRVLDGKYEIETLIGAGGMGLVARARHRVLGSRVVIKLVRADNVDNTTRRRFLREARASAAIDSEHVVRVLDAGTTPRGRPYLVLEHLEGRDLAQELALRGKLPVTEAVDYVMQASEALAVAHSRGIVHRDIKPANLFLTSHADGTPLVKVLDFGIAKAAEDSGLATLNAALTDTGAVMGSPRYMSPEQLQHSAGVDARTDVWALGVVLYELTSGNPPFDAPSVAALASAIMTREPVPLDQARPDVPRALAAVVALCLAKQREERIQSVPALVRALVPFAPAHAATLAERVERIARRERSIRPQSEPSVGAVLAGSVDGIVWDSRAAARRRRFGLLTLGALLAAGAAVALWMGLSHERPAKLFAGVALRGSLAARDISVGAEPLPHPAAPIPVDPAEPRRPASPKPRAAPPASAPAPAPVPSEDDIHRDGLRDRK